MFSAQAEEYATTDEILTYIDTYQYLAISEMETYGIPASIKLAQAILETGAGKSYLAVSGNNHFGIKC
ncbi:MAG: glucosaminidase domain-containing protein, partial [Bacteroidetes bacterium]|nr:glucosaminidase domain-containing protein [Bacteroidota bacterium]